MSDEGLDALKARADGVLLHVFGTEAYMSACALMAGLENLTADMEPLQAAAAISAFNSLVALRYAERRRDA